MSACAASLGAGYIRTVSSFEELLATPFGNGVNALCWKRALPGNFAEIAARLGAEEGITSVEDDDLRALDLSPAGHAARQVLLEDLRLLRDAGLSPSLDCILGFSRDPSDTAVPTDVYSYHADSADAEADTYLCSYVGACSEGLPYDQAIRRVDIPETRSQLLARYGGIDDEGFLAYLEENYYDLHYLPTPDARPFAFGLGNLWRIATKYPGCPVPPCIHRAPMTGPTEPPRLLLIS